ncbi:MAG: hypothetical protein SPK43_00345, partial [Candidatus Onthovivens sp.]|nr:hypothetical protein [Candidatus Onthovivens sp.]
LVKMSVNPELSMVLDENNVVLSISGDNEEGKMLLVDENVVGKEVDEAIEYIINIENETGYLVSGEFVSEPNKITIQISVNDENIKNSLNEVINKAIETTCDKLHIQETVEWAEDITHQNLVELAMKADPTLTSEEANKLTNEQLLDIIKLYQIETAEIYSVELEELYNQIKDYELQFTETEFVNETIKSLGEIYEIFTSTLQSSVNVLQDRIDDVNNIRYNTFVAPNSDYQKQIDEVKAKKEEVITVRNEIANTEEDAIRDSKIAILDTKIAAYQACLEALENIKESCLASIDLYIQSLQSAINSINDLIASLPSQDEVEATLKEKTVELEKKLNEAKTNFFIKFENEYGEDIANAKQKALEYKESLKEKVSEARN